MRVLSARPCCASYNFKHIQFIFIFFIVLQFVLFWISVSVHESHELASELHVIRRNLEAISNNKDAPQINSSQTLSPIIYVLPDLHGDYKATVMILQFAKLIDEDLNWIAAPNVHLVHTGDWGDRGIYAIPILQLFVKLKYQINDRLHLIMGNHDWLNIFRHDYGYVDPKELEMTDGKEGRKEILSLESDVGKVLRENTKAAIILDSTLFSHAGITDKMLDIGIEKLNEIVHDLIMGPPNLWRRHLDKKEELSQDAQMIIGSDGPWLTRSFAIRPDDTNLKEVCEAVDRTLQATGAKRMMIGHNKGTDAANKQGKVQIACNERLYGLDVGVSYVYGKRLKYVRIEGDRVEVMKVVEENKLEACLDRCEWLCCGTAIKASHKIPTCSVGCATGAQLKDLNQCRKRCAQYNREPSCRWTLGDMKINGCHDCGDCEPTTWACRRGCEYYFRED